jgi:hypothetical protein
MPQQKTETTLNINTVKHSIVFILFIFILDYS